MTKGRNCVEINCFDIDNKYTSEIKFKKKMDNELTKSDLLDLLKAARDKMDNEPPPETPSVGSKENPILIGEELIEDAKQLYPNKHFKSFSI